MWSVPELLVSSVGLSVAIYYYFLNRKKTLKNLPPGPWGFPVVGHFPLFGNNPAETFLKWKKVYGPILTVRFGGIRTVILNDSKLIKEAFHMEEFSGRAQLPVIVNMTGGNGLGFVDGPAQIEQRRFAVKTLKEHGFGKSSVEFRMNEEISKFLSNLKAKAEVLDGTPMEMNKLFRFCVSNPLWDPIMGSRFSENDSTLTHLLEMIDKGTDRGSIISQLFWFFPWIARIGTFVGYNPPVQGLKTVYDFIGKQIDHLRLFYVKGQRTHFTDAYFDKVSETVDVNSSFHNSKSKNQQRISTGDVLMAGIDTTTTTMDWLMIYMAREPESQKKLQFEIDTVIGTDLGSRVPCLADRLHMPYTEAVLHELLRIAVIAPLGVFRRTVEDVTFQSFRIPKNTMVISNLYAVHHDPEIWQRPEKFDPERFLDERWQLNKLTGEVMAFGSGKRSCIGEGFARDQLFLLTTNFFRQFSVLPVEGQIPSLDFQFGQVSVPHTFNLRVKKRLIV